MSAQQRVLVCSFVRGDDALRLEPVEGPFSTVSGPSGVPWGLFWAFWGTSGGVGAPWGLTLALHIRFFFAASIVTMSIS